MDANRAHQMGIPADGCRTVTHGLHSWAVTYEGRVLFTGPLFGVCRWTAQLRRLEARVLAK